MKTYITKNIDILIIIFLAVLLYLLIFTSKSLSPSNINLMMNGSDLAQNYLGSALYRSEPFSLDLFAMHKLQYPEVGSALQTDSNPIVSFIFKLLKPFGFKAEYQFFGIWTLFNLIMAAIFSVLIFRYIFNKRHALFQKRERLYNVFLIIISSIFFILSPIVLNRAFMHVNLTAHWIVLASILIYLNNNLSLKTWLCTGLLLFVSTGIHPYFLALVLPVIAALVIKKFIRKEVGLKNILSGGGFLCALIIFCFLCFHLGGGESEARSGYGHYKANLNAFINPYYNESLFIDKMANFSEGEHEGDNYLGLGIIILVACVSFYAIKHRKEYLEKHKEIAFICLLLILFALSCNIHLGNLTILEFNIPRRIFAAFRSSGRFLWPVWYLLVFCSIHLLTKKYKSNVKFIIPVLLIIQLTDLLPLFKTKRDFINNRSKVEYSCQLKSQEWEKIFEEYPHVVFPTFIYWDDFKTTQLYFDFWYQAIKYDITVNTGYITLLKESNKIQSEKALNEVKAGKIPVLAYKAAYIIPDDLYEDLQQKAELNSGMSAFMNNVKSIEDIKYILCD